MTNGSTDRSHSATGNGTGEGSRTGLGDLTRDRRTGALSREAAFTWVRDLIVEEFEVEAEQVSMSSDLIDDLDLDSIDAVSIAVRVEQETGYEIEADQLSALRSVEDVVKLIETIPAGQRA